MATCGDMLQNVATSAHINNNILQHVQDFVTPVKTRLSRARLEAGGSEGAMFKFKVV